MSHLISIQKFKKPDLVSVCFIFLFVLLGNNIDAQDKIPEPKEFFEKGKYNAVIDAYKKDALTLSNNENLFRYAVSHFETNQLNTAKSTFETLLNKRHQVAESNYYLGSIAHHKNRYKEAIAYYKEALRNTSSKSDKRSAILAQIKRCASGLKHSFVPQLAYIESLGDKVNTSKDEFAVRQSPNYTDRFYFSSNRVGSIGGLRNDQGIKDEYFGEYKSDIYYTENIDGQWQTPNALSSLLNGPKNDIVNDFIGKGEGLVFAKGITTSRTEIYVDTFSREENELKYPNQLQSKIVGLLGDQHIQCYNDSTFLFSSKRSSGYGAYDIYITARRNGIWSEPQNIGPEINSGYDEICPFLTSDGRKLFFSSNNTNSIGGFDIFVSEYDAEIASWSTPQNLGFPVNSSGDDAYYTVAKDGMTAIFASNRKESRGGYDLYIAYLKDQERNHVFNPRPLEFLNTDDALFVEESTTIPLDILEDLNKQNPIIDTAATEIQEEAKTIKSYTIGSLFYSSDDVILTPKNIVELDHIADLMLLYPEVNVELQGNGSYEGNPSFELYFSIKRAEKAADYLVEQGISYSRIDLKGFGSNLPVVRNPTGNPDNPMERMNKRIDVLFSNIDSSILAVNHKKMNIPDQFLETNRPAYFSKSNGLSYKVEIAKVGNMFQNNNLRFFNDISVSSEGGSGLYTYAVGTHKRYVDAKNAKTKLVGYGFKDAKIVPFENGIRLTNAQLVDLTNQYPDLLAYLKENY